MIKQFFAGNSTISNLMFLSTPTTCTNFFVLRHNRFCPNTMAYRFPIFDGLSSLLRENIYIVCDNMFMIFSYYVTFVCYYFSPSFIVINDNFYFKSFVGYSNVGRFVHNNNITAFFCWFDDNVFIRS